MDDVAGSSKALFFRLPVVTEELLELLRGLELPAVAVGVASRGVVPLTLVILVTGRVFLADIP